MMYSTDKKASFLRAFSKDKEEFIFKKQFLGFFLPLLAVLSNTFSGERDVASASAGGSTISGSVGDAANS